MPTSGGAHQRGIAPKIVLAALGESSFGLGSEWLSWSGLLLPRLRSWAELSPEVFGEQPGRWDGLGTKGHTQSPAAPKFLCLRALCWDPVSWETRGPGDHTWGLYYAVFWLQPFELFPYIPGPSFSCSNRLEIRLYFIDDLFIVDSFVVPKWPQQMELSIR